MMPAFGKTFTKRERIKRGSGEKMRKKGDKGAPTSDQLKKAKSNYEMSLEEYLEVMDVNDIIEAKRSGPKSGAQTPSKPSERKKGSKKINPKCWRKGREDYFLRICY